jgi:type I restriction enzyme S subunit
MNLLEINLPAGRHWTRVGDVYEVTRKPRGLDTSAHETIPFVPMEAIPQGGEFKPRYAEKPLKAITSGTYFERGDILIAKITPSFENGKQAFVEDLPTSFGYATTEIIPLRPKVPGQDKRLLFYYLLHPDIRSFVAERMEGTTGRQRIPEAVLLDLPFPQMPGRDQRAIADVLDRVRAGINIEQRAEQIAQELKRAAMRELFTRGLRGEAQKETEIGLMPESWEVVRLCDVCQLSTGTTPSTKRKDYYEGDVPFIKTADILNNRLSTANTFVSHQAVQDYSLKIFPPGTVLMAMYGQGKTRGQVSLLELAAATTQNAAALQPIKEMDSTFLWQYLMSNYERLRGMGSLGHISHLNLGYLRELLIEKPSLSEQREIVAILNAIDRKIALHQKKRAALEELFRALLHKLMTGEIRVANLDLSALEAQSA